VISVLLVAGLGTAFVVKGFLNGRLSLNHPSVEQFPVRGIDVSHYQGTIDWARVRADGVDFAYVKATEGGDFTDPAFTILSEGARRAGVRVGAYHYFTFCTGGAAQARQFLAVTGGPKQGDLPPVVDLEFGGNCSRVLTPAELDREYAAFEAPVRAAFGRSPVLYVTTDIMTRYLAGAEQRGSALAARSLWIRNIVRGPGGGCERWSIWQYTNRGQVDGVAEAVDLDVYCGTRQAFEQDFAPTR
jgi:lysozyme